MELGLVQDRRGLRKPERGSTDSHSMYRCSKNGSRREDSKSNNSLSSADADAEQQMLLPECEDPKHDGIFDWDDLS